MDDRKGFGQSSEDPFDGEFDPSVFGDDFTGQGSYADDDFKEFFDPDIVTSGIENRGNMFDVNEENFGKDGFTQFYSTEGGRRIAESDLRRREADDATRVIKEQTGFAPKDVPGTEEDDPDKTQRIDELKAPVREIKNSNRSKSRPQEDKRGSNNKPEAENGEEQMSGKKTKQRRGWLGGILYVLFVVLISGLLAGAAWILSTDVLGLGKEDKTVIVTVPKDFTIKEVTDMLHDEDVVRFKSLFKLFAKISHAEDKISGGTYELNANYDYRAIVTGMTKSGGKMVEVTVVIPEGYNLKQIFKTLEEESVCFAEDLEDAAANYDFEYDFLDESTLGDPRRLEGYLFPDTYKFYMNDTPSRVLGKMLDNFDAKFTDEYKEKAASMGYSMRDIVTVASIIEKEAAGDKDRADIASVIYNRLKNTSGATMGYLQLDSTINYIIYGTNTEFSTEIDSPYNTYKYQGLPAGPISNPGIAAIKAALNPNDTGYYYFALNKDGEHEFFRNYNSFIDFVNGPNYGG